VTEHEIVEAMTQAIFHAIDGFSERERVEHGAQALIAALALRAGLDPDMADWTPDEIGKSLGEEIADAVANYRKQAIAHGLIGKAGKA
jgi:hypothetical protein